MIHISKIRYNYTLIEKESKYFSQLQDKYLLLPHIIEFNVIKEVIKKYTPKIMIAVLSSPHNFKKRYSFRTLSMKYCNHTNKCKFIFFIGSSLFENKKLLNKENIIYNDIVKFSFQNSYLNLTLLSVMALKYCYRAYENIEYLIKTDDDMNINYHLLFSTFSTINKNSSSVYGHKDPKFKVNRNIKRKSYIPRFQYPFEYCPEYVYGGLIIITYPSLKKIYKTIIQSRDYIWKEDVNLGVICKDSNVSVNKFPLNYDIRLGIKNCVLQNTILGDEIYNKYDIFYCIN